MHHIATAQLDWDDEDDDFGKCFNDKSCIHTCTNIFIYIYLNTYPHISNITQLAEFAPNDILQISSDMLQ